MFGTFYRNVPPENASPNILKCFIRSDKTQISFACCYMQYRRKIFIRFKQPQFIFHKTFHFSQFIFSLFLLKAFEIYQVNETSERITFLKIRQICFRKFIKNFFARKIVSRLEIKKKAIRKLSKNEN
jgi:hypothetical protein